VFVWWALTPERLEAAALKAIEDSANDVYFSVASAWELAIKAAMKRVELPASIEGALDQRGVEKLGISFSHASHAGELPRHHRDHFDRMLIAQAQSEGLTLVTRDRVFSAYGLPLLKA
jgi:PIN domain nuclease of toxin-antitoxin system